MGFAHLMAGVAGRAVRILAGLILIGIGLYFQGTWGYLIAVVGVVPALAGIFNFCLLSPVFGAPLSGRRLA